MCGSSSSPPPAPDYTGAATATAAGNLDAARVAAAANRVNQITPYGNLTYTQSNPTDPATNQWTATTSLSPTGQQLLDSQNKISLGLGDLGQQGLGYVQNAMSKPFDWSAVPGAPVNPGTTGQAAIMARLQPQINQQNDAFTQQMANQGIAPGTAAYENAHRSIAQQQNDLMSQAALQGINLDTSARQQGIQEQEFGRTEPLNMLNAVRSGAQVQNPSFINVPQQQTTAGPNYLGAAQAQYGASADAYNAQQAQGGNLMNGLFSLGSSAMLGGFNPFSMGGLYPSGGVNLAQYAAG